MTPVKTIIVKRPCWDRPEALEKEILQCVTAERDGTPLPGALAPYWRAFKSPFAPVPGTPFTLYSPFVGQVVLYVYDEKFRTAEDMSRERFFAHCAVIVSRLARLAETVIRLEARGAVSFEFRGPPRPPLPPDVSTRWRRYGQLWSDQSRPILRVMSVDVAGR